MPGPKAACLIISVLLLLAGGCAADEAALPGPAPEVVRMVEVGPAKGVTEMTMAAAPDDTTPTSTTSSTTLPPSTVPATTAAPSTEVPTTLALPTTTRWVAASTVPAEAQVTSPATPDTPFMVAVPVVDMLEVFRDPGDERARWLLPHPGPGEGPRTLLVLHSEADWLQVSVPVRPNGSMGWVRSLDVSTSTYRARIIVDLYRGHLEAWADGALLTEGAVASGSEETPTPPGAFFVTEIQERPDPTTGGTTWLIGTSAYSKTLNQRAEGDPAIAILAVGDLSHLGKTVSQGCIQVPPDVLDRLALLPIGTPIQILG